MSTSYHRKSYRSSKRSSNVLPSSLNILSWRRNFCRDCVLIRGTSVSRGWMCVPRAIGTSRRRPSRRHSSASMLRATSISILRRFWISSPIGEGLNWLSTGSTLKTCSVSWRWSRTNSNAVCRNTVRASNRHQVTNSTAKSCVRNASNVRRTRSCRSVA